MARLRSPVALLLEGAHPGRDPQDWEVSPADLRWLLRSGALFGHLFRHPSGRILLDDVDGMIPLKSSLALRCLTRGPVWVEDRAGRRMRLGAGALAGLVGDWMRDQSRAGAVLRECRRQVAALTGSIDDRRRMPAVAREAGILFLHTDFTRGAVAGGALAHVTGVAHAFRGETASIDLITTTPIPDLDPAIRVTIVPFARRAWSNAEIHRLNANPALLDAGARLAPAGSGRLIYQRSSLHNWTGAALSRRAGLPFVLEYNGAEAWLARHWSRKLRYETLANRIEQCNLEAADLVSVVSAPLHDQLVARGIRDERILVNPNAVDPDRFRPDLDGRAVRERHGLRGHCTIGFIGTFGPWHGGEILADAFALLFARRPDLAGTIRLLLIGDGIRLPAVRARLDNDSCRGAVVFAGLVPQAEAPGHLAACDILVAPTELNPDGSEFFGSPTKLFEYMAMGRGIVASAVGQVAEILRHEHTALLTPPGNPDALAAAIERLVDDSPLRAALGAAARAEAVAKHTWRQHVGRLFDKIAELSAAESGAFRPRAKML